MNARVFVCTHTETNVVDSPIYCPLQTGRAYDGVILDNMLGDDTGENISAQKDIYDGLLTGMYWIWKNTSYDLKGICSYRAYLGNDANEVMNEEDLKRYFDEEDYDWVAVRMEFGDMTTMEQFHTVHKHFYYSHLHNPLRYLENVIREKYPSYISAYIKGMGSVYLNGRHTFVAKKYYFDKFCEWLFDVLEEYVRYLQKINYVMQPRFLGYVAERLERVWIYNNAIKVKEVPLVMVSDREKGMK